MKSIKLFVFIVFTALMVGCSNDVKKKVVFLHPSVERVRFVREGAFMAERLKQLGAEPILVDADDNEALQIEKGMKLLDEGVDMLVITCVNGNTIAPLVRKAKDLGVPVIAFNRLINNCEYDLFVTGDNADIASQLCKYALELKPQGNYVILAGDRFDRNGVELKQGIDSILKPHVESGRIKIIYESAMELWSKESAKYEMKQIIQTFGTDIDAVIACSDPIGLGAIEVLDEYHLTGSVYVCGQDAELDNVKAILANKQTMTVYHPHKVLGYKTAEVVMEMLKGTKGNKIANSTSFNGSASIPTLKIKSVAITKDNIGSELVDKGEYTWDQIKN
jgi:D-xylose transport system substrate-binding protein